MNRRTFLKSSGALALAGTALGASATAPSAAAGPLRRVRPGDPGWPSAAEWDGLRQAVGGRLIEVPSPLAGCRRDATGKLCDAALKDLANPYYIQDQVGGTQSQGWIDAWTTAQSVYAVVPQSAADVAAAVDFAREKNLRLVIKGAGHSYLGQSTAPDSLLLWTRDLDAISLHDAFVPQGCEGRVAPTPAVSVGSGAKFVQLYDAVVTKAGRYVQGGGCTSVGVGGHVQTGGFGSFSKYGGLAAAGLLEAEVVTADGQVRVVNACQDPELFAALRGGGAGFGITTRLTLVTREVPEIFGFYGQRLTARTEAAYGRLLDRFFAFAEEALVTPHWGEQVTLSPDRGFKLAMVFQGLSETEVTALWAPFQSWLSENAESFETLEEPRIVTMPGRHWWDFDYRRKHLPKSIVIDERPDAAPGRFWWSGNGGEVSIYLAGYESIWLPERLLSVEQRADFVAALVEASRHYTVGLHFNKGLAGATPERREEARTLALHPSVADAFALAIIAGGQPLAFPGVRGHEPDPAAARADARRISAAMRALRRVAPEAGSYSSEMSYFEPNWQEAAWGPNYPRLLAAKRKYDPDGLFIGHHQVGSESWIDNGFVRVR